MIGGQRKDIRAVPVKAPQPRFLRPCQSFSAHRGGLPDHHTLCSTQYAAYCFYIFLTWEGSLAFRPSPCHCHRMHSVYACKVERRPVRGGSSERKAEPEPAEPVSQPTSWPRGPAAATSCLPFHHSLILAATIISDKSSAPCRNQPYSRLRIQQHNSKLSKARPS